MFWVGVLFLWAAIGGWIWADYALWVCVLLGLIGSWIIWAGES